MDYETAWWGLLCIIMMIALSIAAIGTYFSFHIMESEGRMICKLTNGPHSEYQGIKDFDIFTGNFSVSCSRMLPPGFG